MQSPRRLLGPMNPHSRRASSRRSGKLTTGSQTSASSSPATHSLGGAIATLAAADIRKLDDPWYLANTELYTFGSPRVGSDHTARFLSKQSTLSYRVTSQNDPIPHMPFLDFRYWHTQPEYWISRNADAPKREDILFLARPCFLMSPKFASALCYLCHLLLLSLRLIPKTIDRVSVTGHAGVVSRSMYYSK